MAKIQVAETHYAPWEWQGGVGRGLGWWGVVILEWDVVVVRATQVGMCFGVIVRTTHAKPQGSNFLSQGPESLKPQKVRSPKTQESRFEVLRLVSGLGGARRWVR